MATAIAIDDKGDKMKLLDLISLHVFAYDELNKSKEKETRFVSTMKTTIQLRSICFFLI